MSFLLPNLRYAFRQLFKNPGYSGVAVLTLALGTGATTALFSVVYAILINPYPYARPGEIWTPGLRSATADQRMRPYSFDAYQEMTKVPGFSSVMATAPGSVLLTGEYSPESIRAVRMSANAFEFLGVQPILGRTIQPSDIRPSGDAETVAVLSFKRWQKMFGGDPGVLGKTLRLNDQTYTIIGVMPSRFGWWTDEGLWLPLGTDLRDPPRVFPIVRLKPDVPASIAEQELHRLHQGMARIHPSDYPADEFTTSLTNYLDITAASGEMQRSLHLLFGAVVFLLVIACANVANLQLSKGSSRMREMAVRLALGARRAQLVRLLLTESVLVALLGGLLGLLCAYGITQLMVAFMPSFLVPNEARIEVNRFVLLFCVTVSALTGILFGLAPALQASRPDLIETLKDEGRGSSATVGGRTRAILVVAEVAASVVLLVSAALTIRSFTALQHVELGFQPEGVVLVNVPLSPTRYGTSQLRNRFAEELLRRVRTLPGVTAATIGNGGLPFGGLESTFSLDARPDPESRRILVQAVGADYPGTLGIPLRKGRLLTDLEIQRSHRVALINESAAALWPAGEDPLGRRITVDELARLTASENPAPTNASPNLTVVGIIANSLNDGLDNQPRPAVLIPYSLATPPQRTLAVRTDTGPNALMNALRAQVREMDGEQPINGPTTVDDILGFQVAQPRFIMALFSLFAGLGLALAMAGIFSVLSYLVSLRKREIGVRIALGARRSDIFCMVLRAGARLVGLGAAIGIVANLWVSRVLRSQLDLFQVPATDPISFVGAAVLLAVVAVAACLIPARSAARMDPMISLRAE